MRREITRDPFEDPARQPNQIRANDVVAVASQARGSVDQAFAELFK
jgi:hypothetical protein